MATEAKIYCYGGQASSHDNSNGFSAVVDQYFFSLSLTQDTAVTAMQSLWEGVNRDVGPNFYFAMTAIASEGRIYMDGGAGAGDSGGTVCTYEVAAFSVDENNSGWVQVTLFYTGGRVETHTATLGNDNKTIYVWGGFRYTYIYIIKKDLYILNSIIFCVITNKLKLFYIRGTDTGMTGGREEHPSEMFIFDIAVCSNKLYQYNLVKINNYVCHFL